MVQLKISIITATFNSSKTIADCISSVNRQTYNDIEHIIIDGASTDNTLEIINSIPNRVTKIISEPDNGIYDAMNKGIQLATGDIVGILNSDDFYIDENAVSKIIEKLNQDKSECVYANVLLVDFDDTNKINRIARNPIANDHVIYNKTISKHSLNFEMIYRGWHPNHPSFFVKKELYTKYGAFNTNYRIEADFDLMFRFLVLHNASLSFLDANILKMREGGASTASLKQYYKSISSCVNIIKGYGYQINKLSYFAYRLYFKVGQFSFYGFIDSFKHKSLN